MATCNLKKVYFIKRFISLFLSMIVSSIGIVAYADTVSIDLSKQVVSYVEYDEITDVNAIFALADSSTMTAFSVEDNADNRLNAVRLNDNQVQLDQLISETVYANGDVHQERINTLATGAVSKIDYEIYTGTVQVVSKLYYTYDEVADVHAHHLVKGGTAITYNSSGVSVQINQTLEVIGPYGMAENDCTRTAVHYNVPVNTEKFVYYPSSYGYNFSDPECVAQMYNEIALSSGEVISFYHSYFGENDWIT